MYITTRFQSSHYNTSICMLLVCMITVMVKLWHKKWSKKHKHVHLQEWIEIVYWRQQGFIYLFFYTEPNPQKSVKEHKNKRWPIYCHGVCCLGRFTVFWFSYSHSRSLLVHKTRTPTRKRLVTTPKGMLVRPCSWSRCVLTPLPEPKGAPVPSHTCTHTHTLTYVLHSEEVQCVSVCLREEGEFDSS